MEKGWLHTSLHGNVTYHYYPNQPGDPRISGNVSVTTSDFECFGQIKGDPDVAGLGVLIGVNLASCVAIIASILAFWFPYAREHWERTVARRKPAAESQNSVSPSANATGMASWREVRNYVGFSRRRTGRTTAEASHADEGLASEDDSRPNDHSNDLTPTETFILNLGDLNLSTSLAIIISSMINMHSDPNYPLYHIFIARSLAASAIVGHNSTTFIYTKFQEKKRYRLWMRWFLSLSVLVLYTIWCGQALNRFQKHEGQRFMPMCLSDGGNFVPGSWASWIWRDQLFIVPMSYLWILVSPFPWTRQMDDMIQYFDAAVIGNIVATSDRWAQTIRKEPLKSIWQEIAIRVYKFSCFVVTTTASMVFVLLCALILPSDTSMPLSHGIFGIVWIVYDIYTIRKGNAAAIVNVLTTPDWPASDNPEAKWGFGQIFPVVMLLQLFIAFLDYALDATMNEDRLKKPDTPLPRSWPGTRSLLPARRGTQLQVYRLPWEV